MSQTAALSVGFGEDTPAKKDEDVFNPSNKPWMYDPAFADSILNVIGPCDKWVVYPWVGFDYHLPAITYRQIILDEAYKNMAKMYEDAKKGYFKEWQDYWNRQELLKHPMATLQAKYGTEEVGLNLLISTAGVSNTSVYSTYTGNKPRATVEVSFSPQADTPSPAKTIANPNKPNACKPVPWEVVFEGEYEWLWNKGGEYTYNSAFDSQTNFIIDGDSTVQALTDGYKPNDASGFTPERRWYFYYDGRYNDSTTPSVGGTVVPYLIKNPLDTWSYVLTPSSRIKVKDACRILFKTQPINPLPVPAERIQRPVPLTFPAMIKINRVEILVAVAYIPPSGLADMRSSSTFGTRYDITSFCSYEPDTNSDQGGGKLWIDTYNFRSKINDSLRFKYRGVLAESIYGQHGKHTLEICIMGIEAFLTIFDEKGRAKTVNVHKAPEINLYVPRWDKGEYLWRKQWQVFNPAEKKGALVKLIYKKVYGQIGVKQVVDITNPFDRDMVFFANLGNGGGKYISEITTGDSDYKSTHEKTLTVIKVPYKSTRRVTMYGQFDRIGFHGEYWFCPADNSGIGALTDLQPFTRADGETYREVSEALAFFPTTITNKDNAELAPPVAVTTLPILDNAFGIGMHSMDAQIVNSQYSVSFASGQYITSCTVQRYTGGWANYYTGVAGIYRQFSDATMVFLGTPDYDVNDLTTGNGTSYIDHNITEIFQNPYTEKRKSPFSYSWYFPSTAVTLARPLFCGGAVTTFCTADYNASLSTGSTHTVSMDYSQINRAANNGVLYDYKPPWVTTTAAYYPVEPLNYVYGTTRWKTTSYTLGASPPTVECVMRSKVLDGWHNGPIEVFVPYIGTYWHDL